MKLVLILLGLIGTTEVNSYSFKPKKIVIQDKSLFNQVIKNKPDIDKKFAKRLSFYIDKHAVKYKADPHRALAIAMQESGYRNIASKKKGRSFDIGMFQINIKTVKEYKFDEKRLLTDLEYAVEAYFKVVTNKKKLCKFLKEDAWSCYHSKTKELRLKYKKMVNRYYPKKVINEKKIVKN